MESLGYIIAIGIGVALSTFGSGGSILAVPTLVYVMHIAPPLAILYSLFIVGVTSLVSILVVKKFFDYKIVFTFGIPSIAGVFVMRSMIIPLLPQEVTLVGHVFSYDKIILILFACSMLLASVRLLFENTSVIHESKESNIFKLIIVGFVTGMVTGLLGVGGGFLIIPALMYFTRMSMQAAAGVSLILIAVNTLSGFFLSLHQLTNPDWKLLVIFTMFSLLGVVVGGGIKKTISPIKLQRYFGWFIGSVALCVLFAELFSL